MPISTAAIPAFVINLAHDTARRQHMQQQLQRVGLTADFVPAVNGRTLTTADRLAYDHAKALRVYGTGMMDTEIGCYLSHYRLWQHIVDNNVACALIMEDDIEISPDLPSIVAELVADPDPAWLVVRLESLRGQVRQPKKPKFIGTCIKNLDKGQLYRLDSHVLGFGAYLLRLEGARRMLAYGQRIFMPVDQTMDRFWENGIAPYIVRPLPVQQRADFESRIGARPPNRHKGQPVAQYLARRWQRLSDSFRKRWYLLRQR